MPYNRPGAGVYVVNGASAINHGSPQVNAGFVGVAVKQQNRAWDQGLANQAVIDPNEPYYLITKGVVQVPNTGITANVKGDPIYISAAGALTATGPAGGKFGRIVEVAGQRGVPANKVRIDLDAKDSFV